MPTRDTIVIGCSSGGLAAVSKVLAGLPAELPACVCVVQHTSRSMPSMLAEALSQASPLPVTQAKDGEALELGHVYVSRPDLHLLVRDGHLQLSHGPAENGHRPAVDALFRSAAVMRGSRTIGVVLSGYLDDGTAGLLAIKRQGGLAVVQDPSEAESPDMPRSALAHAEVDHVCRVAEMGPLLAGLAGVTVPPAPPPPPEMVREEQMAVFTHGVVADDVPLGAFTGLGCPDCSAPLFAIHERGFERFRCRFGHGFTIKSLLLRRGESLEGALWSAMAALSEKATVARRMATASRRRGDGELAARFEDQVRDAEGHTAMLQRILADEHLPPLGASGGEGDPPAST